MHIDLLQCTVPRKSKCTLWISDRLFCLFQMPPKINQEMKVTSSENLNTELLELEKIRYHLEGGHTSFTEKNTTKSKIDPGPQRSGGMATVHGFLNTNITHF